MSEKSEKQTGALNGELKQSSPFIATKGVKATIGDKSYERLRQEAQDKEISKSELVRHIIYEYQKKESAQSKPE